MKLPTNLPESVKIALAEAGRTVVLAIIPILILGIDTAHGSVTINWMLVEATALLTLLRFVDKWLHEKGTTDSGWLGEKGLTGF